MLGEVDDRGSGRWGNAHLGKWMLGKWMLGKWMLGKVDVGGSGCWGKWILGKCCAPVLTRVSAVDVSLKIIIPIPVSVYPILYTLKCRSVIL